MGAAFSYLNPLLDSIQWNSEQGVLIIRKHPGEEWDTVGEKVLITDASGNENASSSGTKGRVCRPSAGYFWEAS